EQPIFTTRAHVFQIDPTTKKNWVPASKQAVTVSYFYDSTRNSYRIISVDGSKETRGSLRLPQLPPSSSSSPQRSSGQLDTPHIQQQWQPHRSDPLPTFLIFISSTSRDEGPSKLGALELAGVGEQQQCK
ncbi:hypothetical protein CRUP_004244, partial [Coryphaenoides rupestris]